MVETEESVSLSGITEEIVGVFERLKNISPNQESTNTFWSDYRHDLLGKLGAIKLYIGLLLNHHRDDLQSELRIHGISEEQLRKIMIFIEKEIEANRIHTIRSKRRSESEIHRESARRIGKKLNPFRRPQQ